MLRKSPEAPCGSFARAARSSRWPLLRATLLEVERLRPVTPLGVPHGTLATVRLASGAVLPPATMIIPLHWAVNMDTELWDRPEEFRPNR